VKRLTLFAAFVCLPIVFATALGGGRLNETREALQELNEFIGQWNGTGSLPENRQISWREKAEWSWRFKGKDAWLEMKNPDGKYITGGELRWLPKQEKYQFTATDRDKNKLVFTGELKGKKLTLERVDPQTKATQQVLMNTAAEGIRFIVTVKEKSPDRTFFSDKYQVGFTKEGEAFATAKTKPECIVTGGLGTISVTFQGATYYVCCSGCRDAFNENPAKVIADYEKKKKKGR
jgi:hypothetical protein